MIVARLRALQTLHERILARALERYFQLLAAAVVRRFLALSKAVGPGDLVTPEDEAELQRIIMRSAAELISEYSALTGELVGVEPLTEGMPGYSLLRREVAGQVVDISATTRRAIQDTLLEGLERGFSARQIANGVPAEDFRGLRSVVAQTYRNRHEAIARTEVAFIANRTTEDRYRAGGVAEVDIDDGPDCGWTSHDDPDKADGSRRTLEELHDQPLSHPQCVRVPLPVVEF